MDLHIYLKVSEDPFSLQAHSLLRQFCQHQTSSFIQDMWRWSDPDYAHYRYHRSRQDKLTSVSRSGRHLGVKSIADSSEVHYIKALRPNLHVQLQPRDCQVDSLVAQLRRQHVVEHVQEDEKL